MHKDPIQPLFIGQQKLVLPSCHSTNQVAADLLSAGGVQDGMLVITANQTAGKGQRGNSWESQPYKNLTLSIILKPKFLPVQRHFDLTVITSLALVTSLAELGLAETSIKWPNDIYYEDRKLAGILIKNTLRSESLESTIIGIGLNVNQTTFKTPNATSMRLQTGQQFSCDEVLAHLLKALETYYLELKSGESSKLRKQYLKRLRWLNEVHTFQNLVTKTPFRGSIQGIDLDGRLLIKSNQQVSGFDFKELGFLE